MEDPKARNDQLESKESTPANAHTGSPATSQYQSFLIVDTYSWESLIKEPCCRPGELNILAPGFESYIIEQWLCERRMHTVVVSYTGNSNDVIQGHILHVPVSRDQWGAKLTQFIDDLGPMHLIPQETPFGQTFITNLSSFPSNWTLISFKGPYSDARNKFILSENYKRFGCLGRSAVSLDAPAESSVQKFRTMFMIPSGVPSSFAVREIVTLAQLGLYYFDLIDGEIVDGLLCDKTLSAMKTWWMRYGTPHFRLDPSAMTRHAEAVCSVISVIGLVRGLRTRLVLLGGTKIPKDVFSVEEFLKCVRQYQKSERIPRSGRLDAATTWRIVSQSAKLESSNFASDLLTSLKSTVKESLGRPAQSADIFETHDIRVIVATVKGGRAAYLWRGIGSQYTPRSSMDNLDFGVSESLGIPLRSLAVSEKASKRDNYLPSRLRRKAEASPQNHVSSNPLLSNSATSLLGPGSPGSADNLVEGKSKHRSMASIDTYFDSEGDRLFSPSSTNQSLMSSPFQLPDSAKKLEKSHPHLSPQQLLTQDDSLFLGSNYSANDETHRGLRRTLSASNADDIILRWNTPVSFLKIVRLIKQARSHRQQLFHQMTAGIKQQSQIKESNLNNNASISAEQRANDAIKFEVTASSRKEQAVRSQLRELEAYVAKLDYEYAFLNSKLRDVENTVASFGRKVEAISARWKLVTEPQHNSVFTRLKTWLKFS